MVYEGTNTIKNYKIQKLASEFETIRMKNSDTIAEFHSRLKDIVNSLYNLNEIIPEYRVVKKILKSLLDRFIPKITVIEESKYLNTLKKNKLLGSFQTFETNSLSKSSSQKKESIAFKVKVFQNFDDEVEDIDLDKEEKADLVKNLKKLLRLSKNFKNILKPNRNKNNDRPSNQRVN